MTARVARPWLVLTVAVLIALAGVGLGAGWAKADPTFPPLTGRVVDDAHVLSPQTQAELGGELAALEDKTGDQVVVVTLPSLQGYPIEDYGYQLGRAWGIGQKGKDNGLLFIVAPSEHKVRIEVGYGLEPVITDAVSSVILQEAVLPKFRDGDVEGGVVDGTNALVKQLGLSPQDAQASVAQAEATASAPDAPPPHRGHIFSAVLIVIFVVFVIFGGLGRRGGFWMLPFLFMGGGGRGFGDDDRGGGFGGGGGGGGFSGGGGSFGGGGASGGW